MTSDLKAAILIQVDASPEITADLRSREPFLHREPPGSDRAYFEALLAPDYFEVGASGRVYDRDLVLDIVEDRYSRDEPAAEHTIEDFQVREVAPHTYIASYTLNQPDGHSTRVTRRSTVWSRAGEAWQAVYHQGTIVAA